MANEQVQATIDMADDAVIVPVGVVGAAAGGSLGGALGTEELMAEADPIDENEVLQSEDLEPTDEETDAVHSEVTRQK
jgi:hypothetical protein